MPYKIEKESDGRWHVINTATGDDKGGSDSRADAISHMRVLYLIEEGKEPRKK
jgi:hypothetical protein